MRFSFVLTALLACACSEGPAALPDDTDPSIEVVAGVTTDTVDAEPVQALVIRVHGVPAGTVVRFEAILAPATALVWVGTLTNAHFDLLATSATSADGRASARIKLGSIAGTGKVSISVPEFGLSDTAAFMITAGGAAGVRVLPADTTLPSGGSYQPRAAVVDRYDNPRTDPVTLFAIDPGPTIAGMLVTVSQTGRYRIRAVGAARADTGFISVVPDGVISGIEPGAGGVRVVRTDGSELRTIYPGPVQASTADWNPDGTMLALDATNLAPIKVVTVNGALRQITMAATSGIGTDLYPEWTSDGQWLAYGYNGPRGLEIRRVRGDGTGELLLPGSEPGSSAPSFAPDGIRFAYTMIGPDELHTRDFGGGQIVNLAPVGHTPAWRPTGDLIAFVVPATGAIHVIAPDGTGHRQVSAPGASYLLGIDWSPDGKWLLAARSFGRFDLIEVATGTTLPLAFTQNWTAPAWKQ